MTCRVNKFKINLKLLEFNKIPQIIVKKLFKNHEK